MTKDAWKAALYAIRDDVRKLSEVPDVLTNEQKLRILDDIGNAHTKLTEMVK